MGKLTSDINFLNRNNKRRIVNGKKQEIKLKRKKRKKDLEKLHQNVVEASKNSFTRVYRNGAKGREIRKRNQPPNKLYKARLQGEVAKLLDRDTSKKSPNPHTQSPKIIHIDLENKEKKVVTEDSVSSEDDTQCPLKITKKHLTTSRRFPWSAMFRYEEFCAIICSENFDDRSVILSQLPDPLKDVKESLKRVHTNAIRQHFSRPDMDINEYIINVKNQSSSKTLTSETDRIHISNIPTECYPSGHTSNTALTADIVEDSHSEISPKMTSEIENKAQSSNILFSLSMKQPKNMRKKNADTAKNFHLSRELFYQPSSTSTTLMDNESIMEKHYARYAKCHIDDVKYNTRLKKHDKHMFKNCTEYIENIGTKKPLVGTEMRERFTFINDSSKRNVPRDRAHEQKYIEDLIKDYKSRRTIQDATDISDTDICTNLKEQAVQWKATKNLKHVPGILRRGTCNLMNLNDLTYSLEQKCNNVNFKGTSKKHLDLNLNICPSGSLSDTVKNVQRAKTNKLSKNQHRMMKEEPSTSTHRTVNCRVPIEMSAKHKNNKLDMTKESNRYGQFRPQKSVTFSKGILLNADPSTTQLHYDQNHDSTKLANVDKSATTIKPINCQILDGSQHVLLNHEQMHQPNVKFIQPTQYIECSQNSRDNNESIPVYLQIINEPMKARAEQNMTNQLLINKPVTTFATCEKTLPNQSMIQQPIVPVASQNLQFMFRESDPRFYAFNELQNLQLLTLNDSQNIYVSTLSSAHEQKRANECAILHNVNQPTKYLAFEKDLNTQRIPIYFHNNNDKTVTQQYLPCKVVTAVEKQNNDTVFIQEPPSHSQVILVQGSNLQNEDRQFIDRNYKHLI